MNLHLHTCMASLYLAAVVCILTLVQSADAKLKDGDCEGRFCKFDVC